MPILDQQNISVCSDAIMNNVCTTTKSKYTSAP